MLHTDSSQAGAEGGEARTDPLNAYPGVDEPYACQERSIGVLFYQAKHGFFFPYHYLQSMDFSATRVALEFPGEIVVITGRGLHGLCVGLARQAVSRVVEQGERGSTAATCILRIRRIPKEPGTQAGPRLDSE